MSSKVGHQIEMEKRDLARSFRVSHLLIYDFAKVL